MFSPTFQSSFWIFAFVRVDKGFHYHFSHEGKVTNPSIWLVLFLSLPSRNSSTTSNHIKSFVSFRFSVRGIWRMIILVYLFTHGERWITIIRQGEDRSGLRKSGRKLLRAESESDMQIDRIKPRSIMSERINLKYEIFSLPDPPHKKNHMLCFP